MNSYFVQHPEMVLGDMVMESTRFGPDSACKAREGADLSELLAEAVQFLQAEIKPYELEELGEEEDRSIPADPNVRNFSYTVVDGQVYYRENSRMHPLEVSVTAENRIRGMIELRECVRRLIDYQTEGYPDADVKEEQAKLNTLYDSFTKKYGLISSRGNKLAFSEDSSYCLLCSLEVLDEDGSLKRKTDMFTKRTIRPHVAVTSVDTASEALAVSIAEKARVDMEYMAQLSGKSPEELEAELSGVIFRNIEGPENPDRLRGASLSLQAFSPVTADEYLSGNVRRKLRMAKAFLEAAPDSQKAAARKQVEALEAVQPHDLGAGEIGVRIGANWVPIDVYQQFMVELLLPPPAPNNQAMLDYLKGRGISMEVLDFCVQTGRIYESRNKGHGNVVFVGFDKTGKARFGCLRGISEGRFHGDLSGSDKHYSFALPACGKNPAVHLCECAIDVMSYASLCRLDGIDWKQHNLLSLAGVYQPKKKIAESKLPVALTRFLEDYPHVKTVYLHLDNDGPGRMAAEAIQTVISKEYEVKNCPPPRGKDVNDYLCRRLGIPIRGAKGKEQER